MKKKVLMLILTSVIFALGCANEEVQAPQVSPTTEAESEKDDESLATDNTKKENDSLEQNNLSSYDVSSLDDYMVSVEEQSESIKDYLEHEAMTQVDMNMKSQELYELWDDALNYVWGELKTNLPEEEYAKLLDEQHTWIEEKENALAEAGKEVEGGSLYPLIVNSEAAKITEERVYELYTLLK